MSKNRLTPIALSSFSEKLRRAFGLELAVLSRSKLEETAELEEEGCLKKSHLYRLYLRFFVDQEYTSID